MRRMLGIDDVLLQVALTAIVHGAMGSEWSLRSFSERAGIVVPTALIVVALWRMWLDDPTPDSQN